MKIKKRILYIIAVFMIYILIILYTGSNYTRASDFIPQEIRIGLYFDYEQRNIHKALSCLEISAINGIEAESFESGELSALYSKSTANKFFVRKDSYYIKQETTYIEYDPTAESKLSGEKIGPYHVKIDGVFKDYNSALAKTNEIKNKGIDAYPVYTGEWQLWTGFYISRNEALKDITEILKKKLGAGTYVVVNPSDSNIVIMSDKNSVLFLYANDLGLLRVKPGNKNNPRVFNINNTKYRGFVEIRRFDKSDMTVINVLPLEQYIYGVVPCEIEISAHPEALKAQAVAARTYAVRNINKYKTLDFNLCNTSSSQVYKGFSREEPETNKAVDDTRGKLVMYERKPARVYYFSSSGGRTENCENVWTGSYPYLISVEDKYEKGDSYNYYWQKEYSSSEIKALLENTGYNPGNILGIQITEKSDSGRAVRVEIQGSLENIVFEKEECRSMFGSLYSQWYDITTDSDITVTGLSEKTKVQINNAKIMTSEGIKNISGVSSENITIIGANNNSRYVPIIPKKYVFTGKGWGHAVGMSQEGAKGMAQEGFTYEQILTYYFNGTKVE